EGEATRSLDARTWSHRKRDKSDVRWKFSAASSVVGLHDAWAQTTTEGAANEPAPVPSDLRFARSWASQSSNRASHPSSPASSSPAETESAPTISTSAASFRRSRSTSKTRAEVPRWSFRSRKHWRRLSLAWDSARSLQSSDATSARDAVRDGANAR